MHQSTPYLTRSSSGIFYFRVTVPVHLRICIQAMHDIEVEPATEAQRYFLEVCADLVEPETEFEQVWVKYLKARGR